MALRIYIFYMVFIWWGDVLDFFSYIVGLPQVTITSRLFAFLLAFLVDRKVCRQWAADEELISIDWMLFVVWFLCGGLYVWKAVLPDMSADVVAYHLYLQIPGFRDVFHYNYAPGGFQTLFFPLADRMFYWFRFVFGYRLGTVLNYLIVCLAIGQVRRIYIKFHIKAWIASLLAFGSVMVFHLMLIYCGTYMVDLVAVPLLLEMLYRSCFSEKEDNRYWWLIFLGAFSLALKLTNIIYVLPILVVYMLSSSMCAPKRLFYSCILMAIPSAIYLIYSYLESGNPVFPLYNAIFQSPYFPFRNFKDTRWGPSLWWEYLIWPIHIITAPKERLAEISDMVMALAWIGPLFCMGVYACSQIPQVKKKLTQKVWVNEGFLSRLYITLIISMYLWVGMTGYARYFVFGFILGNIGVCCVCHCLWKHTAVFREFVIILLLILLLTPFRTASLIEEGFEWSWRRPLTLQEFTKNAGHYLHDREFLKKDMAAAIEGFIFCTKCGQAIASNISPKVPSLSRVFSSASDLGNQIFNQRLLWAKEHGVNLYDILSTHDTKLLFQSLEDTGLFISHIDVMSGNVFFEDRPWVVKLDSKTAVPNTIAYLKQERIEVPIPHQDECRIHISAGWFKDWTMPEISLALVAVYEDGREQILLNEKLSKGHWINVDTNIHIQNLEQVKKMYLCCLDMTGKKFIMPEWNYILIINFSLT